jgi:hypothetical protein
MAARRGAPMDNIASGGAILLRCASGSGRSDPMHGALVTRLSGLRATLQRSRLSDPGRVR